MRFLILFILVACSHNAPEDKLIYDGNFKVQHLQKDDEYLVLFKKQRHIQESTFSDMALLYSQSYCQENYQLNAGIHEKKITGDELELVFSCINNPNTQLILFMQNELRRICQDNDRWEPFDDDCEKLSKK